MDAAPSDRRGAKMTLIGNHITRRHVPLVSDPSRADPDLIRKAFVPTLEARAFCARISALIAPSPRQHTRALLLIGERGTGKTHLARYVESLLANPQDPEWNAIQGPKPDPARTYTAFYVHVPEEPSVDLAGFLIQSLKGKPEAPPGPAEAGRLPAAELLAAIKRLASGSGARTLALISFDGFSRRMARLVDNARIRQESDICRATAEALCQCGILPVILADEEPLRRLEDRSPASVFQASLRGLCDIFRLSRTQVENVISGALAEKGSAQRSGIQKVFKQLIERLPRFAAKSETFTELYPIHPQLFSILFPLRAVLPDFSPLAFAQAAIESAGSRSEIHLVTHETLFDFVLPDLRSCTSCTPFLRSYDELCSTAIARMSPTLQGKARALLKGIALTTICDTKAPSVRTLANALLLYDEAQPLPSHSLAAAILIEMEDQGRSFLAGEGEGFDRSYHLMAQQMYAVSSALPGKDLPRDDLRLRLPQLVYDWFHLKMPCWRPNPSPRYWRTSLTLLERIPEGTDRSVGMVHFKNVQDPFWSRDDLANLEGSAHRWILLILSPFEHFYEFDAEIEAAVSASQKIIVWHPDTPTPDEAEQLRRLALNYRWSPAAEEQEAGAFERSKEALEIITALYVTRGRFLTSRGQWALADEIGEQTLAGYLSGHLRAVASRSPDADSAIARAPEGPEPDGPEEESQALHWAALLSGEEDMRRLEPGTAEARLIAWWTSSLESNASALAARLNPLPAVLMTTRFWNEYRQFVRHLDLLLPTLQLLRMGAITFVEAMSQVRLHFRKDESLLLRWKVLLAELAGLARWLPALEHMREYVCGAFPTSIDRVDGLRTRLLELIRHPHELISTARRDEFDGSFLEFKTRYADCYLAGHEEAMSITAEGRGTQLKIDSDALRNLELLSRLPFANKDHVNRVRIIGRWLRSNRCPLPARQILERQPRCYCGFNPLGDPRIGAADRINSLVRNGIEYYRTVFQRLREPVIDQLKKLRVDQESARQIAPLLGDGDMLPLSPHAVEVLNRIMESNPQVFKSAFPAPPS